MKTTCKKCETDCYIESDELDLNDSVAWCEVCDDYAEGFDATEFASDYLADMADTIMDRIKEGS